MGPFIKNKQKTVLQIIGAMFVFGGLVRLFANEATFKAVGIEELWIEDIYHIYIYRVLGAFVIFTGLLLFSISRNIDKNKNVLNVFKWGLVLIGATMIITGYRVKLPALYFAPDFIFCFAIALYLHISAYIYRKK